MVAADVRRRISARKTIPPPYLGGYRACDDSPVFCSPFETAASFVIILIGAMRLTRLCAGTGNLKVELQPDLEFTLERDSGAKVIKCVAQISIPKRGLQLYKTPGL